MNRCKLEFAAMKEITQQAVKLAGGPSKVSEAIIATGKKCSPQAVSQWVRVPDIYVRLVEELGGGKMTRYRIRPDIFGEAPAGEAVSEAS